MRGSAPFVLLAFVPWLDSARGPAPMRAYRGVRCTPSERKRSRSHPIRNGWIVGVGSSSAPSARSSARRPERFSAPIMQQEECALECRVGCGACCIAPSITSPIPGMPEGKPAGVRCVQLSEDNRCLLFGKPERPAVCTGLQPSAEMCRESAAEAMAWLNWLEESTAPGGGNEP